MEENYNRHVRMLFIVFQCTHTHISRSVVAIFTLHAYFTTYSTTRLGICRLIGTFRAEHSKIELHQIEREMNCSPRREAIYHFHHPFSRQMRLMPNSTVFYFAYYEQVFTVRGIHQADSMFFIHFSPILTRSPLRTPRIHVGMREPPLHELFYYWIS